MRLRWTKMARVLRFCHLHLSQHSLASLSVSFTTVTWPPEHSVEIVLYHALQRFCLRLSAQLWSLVALLWKRMWGNARPQSSQLAEPLWTDPGIKSGISVRELISTLKKKRKQAQSVSEWLNILPKSLQVRKKPRPLRKTFERWLSQAKVSLMRPAYTLDIKSDRNFKASLQA